MGELYLRYHTWLVRCFWFSYYPLGISYASNASALIIKMEGMSMMLDERL